MSSATARYAHSITQLGILLLLRRSYWISS
jgi:hypothetical protein